MMLIMFFLKLSSIRILVGIIQFNNYLRAMQIMAIVGVVNNLLTHLSEKMTRELRICETELADDGKTTIKFDERATSMRHFELIEKWRELFMRIWRVQQQVNDCFGASFIVITMNAFLCQTFSFYFSIISTRRFVDFFSQTFLHTFHITTVLVLLVVFCETTDKLVSEMLIQRQYLCL